MATKKTMKSAAPTKKLAAAPNAAAHSTNYVDTFIAVATDCRAPCGTVPKETTPKTVARLQWEMLANHPYQFTSDDVIFAVYADRHGIADADRAAARVAFFSKGQPCLRASPLTKTHGWGVHADRDGKVALYGSECDAYTRFVDGSAPGGGVVEVTRAMRSGR